MKEPEQGILFPGITRPDADEGFVSCVKYLFNKFFFHFGWEVSMAEYIAFYHNYKLSELRGFLYAVKDARFNGNCKNLVSPPK